MFICDPWLNPSLDFHEHRLSNTHSLPTHGMIYHYFPPALGGRGGEFGSQDLFWDTRDTLCTFHALPSQFTFLSWFPCFNPFSRLHFLTLTSVDTISLKKSNMCLGIVRQLAFGLGRMIQRNTACQTFRHGKSLNTATDVCFAACCSVLRPFYFSSQIFHNSLAGHSFKSSVVGFVVYLS
jgi:hypothetical protein